jgi:ABC-2 type transport system ATP-binding protein
LVTTAAQSEAANLASPGNDVAVRVDRLSHRYPPTRSARRSARRADRVDVAPNGAAADAGASNRPALQDVTFQIAAGEIFGILGPNGGGKTTLFRIIATLLRPGAGSVSVFGHDVATQPHRVRQQLGVVFQMPSLDGKLSAAENLRHQGHLHGLRGRDLAARIDLWLDRMNLADRRDDDVEHFSGGMRRRVELAKALLHEPRLLLLDEPATGLDPGARRDVWHHLEHLRRQQHVTVALTTHLMDEADRCDRLAIVSQGQLVALDTPAHLKAMIGGDVITVQPVGDPQMLLGAIREKFGPWASGADPRLIDGMIHMQTPQGAAFVAQLAAAFPSALQSVKIGQPTLEDVFLHVTGQQFDDAA